MNLHDLQGHTLEHEYAFLYIWNVLTNYATYFVASDGTIHNVNGQIAQSLHRTLVNEGRRLYERGQRLVQPIPMGAPQG